MILFVYLNQRYQLHYEEADRGQSLTVNDSHQFVGNSPLLAPYGAPTNPKWQTRFSSGSPRFKLYHK